MMMAPLPYLIYLVRFGLPQHVCPSVQITFVSIVRPYYFTQQWWKSLLQSPYHFLAPTFWLSLAKKRIMKNRRLIVRFRKNWKCTLAFSERRGKSRKKIELVTTPLHHQYMFLGRPFFNFWGKSMI